MHKHETHKDLTTIYLFFFFYAILLFNIAITCFAEKYENFGKKEMDFFTKILVSLFALRENP